MTGTCTCTGNPGSCVTKALVPFTGYHVTLKLKTFFLLPAPRTVRPANTAHSSSALAPGRGAPTAQTAPSCGGRPSPAGCHPPWCGCTCRPPPRSHSALTGTRHRRDFREFGIRIPKYPKLSVTESCRLPSTVVWMYLPPALPLTVRSQAPGMEAFCHTALIGRQDPLGYKPCLPQ